MIEFKHELFTTLANKLGSYFVYLVGGSVRDYLSQYNSNYTKFKNKKVQDFDLVVFGCADLESEIRNIANEQNLPFIVLDAENQIYRIVNNEKKWQADFCGPRGKNIEEDLGKRDFIINAIAYDLAQKKIIDPLNGQKDLEKKILQAISLDNLKADSLRVLRAFRLKAKFGLNIEPETCIMLSEAFVLIDSIAIERISAEIWGLLESENCFDSLKEFRDLGFFEKIFPEFLPQKEVPSNDFHHLPLWEHTFELINQYENFVKPQLPKECLNFIENNQINYISWEAIIKMSCLLHDIAKPRTWEIIKGKHTFYNHDNLGAEMTLELGKRMHWPKAVTQSLSVLVKYHLRPFHIAPIGSEPTEKAERRFFRKLGDNFYPLIALAWADLLSTRGAAISDEMIKNSELRLLNLCTNYEEFKKQEIKYEPLLAGEDLKQAIELSKLPPSKLIKDILKELQDLQLDNEIKTKEQAFNWFINRSQKYNN